MRIFTPCARYSAAAATQPLRWNIIIITTSIHPLPLYSTSTRLDGIIIIIFFLITRSRSVHEISFNKRNEILFIIIIIFPRPLYFIAGTLKN